MYEGLLTVSKKDLSDETIKALKDYLTLDNPEYLNKLKYSSWKPSESEAFLRFYLEDATSISVPRNTFQVLGLPELEYKSSLGDSISIISSIKNRKYQTDYLKDVEEYLPKDVLLEVPCGHGKTILAIYLSSKLGRKTLVLVPTNFLASQWFERVTTFTNASTGILEAKHKKTLASCISYIHSKDIVISTLDMFNTLEAPLLDYIKKGFGTLVLDEAHRLGADTFSPILEKLPTKHRIALTATFRRSDGKHRILECHFGKVFNMPNQLPRAKVYPLGTDVCFDRVIAKESLLDVNAFTSIPESRVFSFTETSSYLEYSFQKPFHSIPAALQKGDRVSVYWKDKEKWFKATVTETTPLTFFYDDGEEEVYTPKYNTSIKRLPFEWETYLKNKKDIRALTKNDAKVSTTLLDSYVIENPNRVRLLRNIIRKCINSGRTVLVLAKRKKVLKNLHNYFKDEYKSALIVSETAKMSEEESAFVQNEAQVIFGINQLAQEGMDIARLDTLIFYHPIIDTEQAVGRIQRVLEDKKQPIVIYPKDKNDTYLGIFKKSNKFVVYNATLEKPITYKDLEKVL